MRVVTGEEEEEGGGGGEPGCVRMRKTVVGMRVAHTNRSAHRMPQKKTGVWREDLRILSTTRSTIRFPTIPSRHAAHSRATSR